MLNTYRFILALCVLQAHLLVIGSEWLAWQAVFSFYVVSGFLITLILNQDYGFEWNGFVRFAVNRALRLLPIYYIVIGLTALAILFIGPLDQLNGSITLPYNAAEWLENLSVLGLGGFAHNAPHRLSPTAWSLAVEGFCYGLLGLFFAKSWARLLLMLAVGVVIAAAQIAGALVSRITALAATTGSFKPALFHLRSADLHISLGNRPCSLIPVANLRSFTVYYWQISLADICPTSTDTSADFIS
jgi:peptidoglycan/LPS O-acetylase OafA/YrhL